MVCFTRILFSCPPALGKLLSVSVFCCWSLALLAWETQAQPTFDPAAAVQVSEELKTIAALRDNLRAFLKNSKRQDDPAVQSAAILNLCQLHAWVVADRRYHTSDALKGVRATCATRLKTYAKELANSQKRAARKQGISADQASLKHKSRFGSHQSGDYYDLNSPDSGSQSDAIGLGSSIADNVSGSVAGGAGQVANYLGHFGPDGDNGPELVALIEATLNPNFWRTNGGPGSIHYYRPGLALVVTATQEMQDRVRSLLLQLK